MKRVYFFFLIFFAGLVLEAGAVTYYLDSKKGNDSYSGLSSQKAWKTLKKASSQKYGPGDHLLLKAGSRFRGKLNLDAVGKKSRPVTVDRYGSDSSLPVIDAEGYLAGIHLVDPEYVEIRNLEITADAGETREWKAKKNRYGVYAETEKKDICGQIHLKNLFIHDIFASIEVKQAHTSGKKDTSNQGMGIFFSARKEGGTFKDILIQGCRIERTGHTGIKLKGVKGRRISGIRIMGNHLKDIGGPGMVPSTSQNILVRSNIVDCSGSSADKRMHSRGSGIWPWSCSNVLIEKNQFMHARGKNDSCGTHIDFNCQDVVVQYNLSVDNEGGFVQILGNNFNCAYRYNISINDGFRVPPKKWSGARGNIYKVSGYVGKKNPQKGPFNSYIYNNTVFVKKGIPFHFDVYPSAEGLLIVNNIFYLPGQERPEKKIKQVKVRNLVYQNNIYNRSSILKNFLPLKDSGPLILDPRFRNPGGLKPQDYFPANTKGIKDRGIRIQKIPGDPVGLRIGLAETKDVFGNPIRGLPGIGAIELK